MSIMNIATVHGRLARTGLALVWLVLVASCSSLPGSRFSMPKGEALDEIRGSQQRWDRAESDRDVNHHRAQGMGLIHLPGFRAYAENVAARLLAQSGVTLPGEVQVRVKASRRWNALATGNGVIFLTLGVLERAESEGELAAVLAHELVHVLAGHTKSDSVELMQQHSLLWTQAALSAREKVRRDRGVSRDASGSAADSKTTSQAALLKVNEVVVGPAWNRSQESQADLIAIDLLVRAGYSPNGLIGVLEKLKEVEVEEGYKLEADEFLYKTALEAEAFDKIRNGDIWDRISAGVDLFVGKAKEVFSDIRKRHPPVAERLKTVNEYIERQKNSGESRLVDSWSGVRRGAEVVNALRQYELASQALGYLKAGNVPDAENTVAMINGSAHSFSAYARSALKQFQGRDREALRYLHVTGPEIAAVVPMEASALHLALGDTAQAVRVLEGALEKYDNPPSMMPEMVRTYRLAQRVDEAKRTAAKCAVRYPSYQDLCAAQLNAD